MTKKLFSTSSISEDNPAPHRTKTLKFYLFGKKILVLTICIFFSFILNAQVSKTLNVTAGSLSTALTTTELQTVTDLTLTGTIDARDFKTMRDNMNVLAFLDLSGVTIASYGGQQGTNGQVNWMYNGNAVPINAFHNSTTNMGRTSLISVKLPESVTSIEDYAFYGCKGLSSFIIPPSVTLIGWGAFMFCTGITSVVIPPLVKSIKEYAFKGCSTLTNVVLSEGIVSIGVYAFSDCIKLTSVSLPSTIKSMGYGVFWACGGLISVNIPKGVTTIGNNAFYECINLNSVTIPSSITSLSEGAFYGCKGLTSAIISDGVAIVGKTAFGDCVNLVSIALPSSITSIEWYCFYNCMSLTNLTIPSSVTSIGEEAFSGCSGLKSIYAYANTPVDLSRSPNVFSHVNKSSCTLYIPVGSKSAYQVATQWKDFTNIVELNAGIVANAGPDQVINEGQVVILDGTGSKSNNNDNALSYKWTAPAGVTLSSETASNPAFIAPEVSTETSFTFSLIINDGSFGSEADEVTITVKQVNKAPIANAGTDQSVNENNLVTFDASVSADPDNDKLNYLWTAPRGISLSSETASNPSFIAPEVSIDTTYTFELTVNDGSVNSIADQVKVTIKQVNKAPIASAGMNLSVNENSLVTLAGSASSDPDQDELSYLWTAPAGITLSSETAKNPTFTAPEVSQDNIYRFILLVNDGKTDSDTSQVSIIVKQVLPVLKLISKTIDSQISSTEVTYQFYLKTGNSFSEESLTPVMNGDTTEYSLEPGEWIVRTSPAKDSSTFVPTYSGNTLEWINAEQIIIPEKGITFKEITCLVPEVVKIGTGQISGYVFEKTDTGTKSISLTNNSGASGNPVPGALIQLFKQGNTVPILSIFTDAQGYYKFDQLEVLDYQIVVEIPGFTQSEKFGIAISADQPLATAYFGVNTTSLVITDTNELLTSSLKIYPNPVVRLVTVEVGRNISFPYSILVYNLDGELLIHQIATASGTILDFSKLVAGAYLIQVCSGPERQSSIVIKR